MRRFFRERQRCIRLLVYVPLFLLWFFLLERINAPDKPYWVSYLPLDDRIPFVPGFAWIYCLWFPFLILPGAWWLWRDQEAFRRFFVFFMLGTAGCLLICTVFPNGQDLRPAALPAAGASVRLVRALYAADTNTNVLPSMHVVGSAAVLYGALYGRDRRAVLPIALLAALISLSTVLIKQHSVLDILAGLVLCAVVWPAAGRLCERLR